MVAQQLAAMPDDVREDIANRERDVQQAAAGEGGRTWPFITHLMNC